jgi:MYXO-CTERM domain-containing protein
VRTESHSDWGWLGLLGLAGLAGLIPKRSQTRVVHDPNEVTRPGSTKL